MYVLCIAVGDKFKAKYNILQGALTEEVVVTGLKYCSSKWNKLKLNVKQGWSHLILNLILTWNGHEILLKKFFYSLLLLENYIYLQWFFVCWTTWFKINGAQLATN